MTVTLYKYGPASGLPDLSPFCIKLETFLRMARIPYTTELGYPHQAPKGKLPYIELDGKILTDSILIVEHLSEAFGVSLDAALDERQAAVGQAFKSMLEDHLYFAILFFRWQHEEGWKAFQPIVTQSIHQAGAPLWLSTTLARLSRKSVLKALNAQGTGRHSASEVAHLACQQLSALSNFLSFKRFFLGDKPSSVDATVYAFLESILTPALDNPLRVHASQLPNLVKYCETMRYRYWSDLQPSVSYWWTAPSPRSQQ